MDQSKHAVAIFDKYAALYQTKFMNVDLYGDTFDFFCDRMPKPNSTILELACGPGNITKYLLGKRPDLKILGTDLAPNMIRLAQENNPTAVFRLMDARDLAKTGKQYDGVMVGFCLPYLTKEETKKLIADTLKVLNPGGCVYFSTMEDDHGKSGYRKGSQGDEIFMHFYTGAFLVETLEENKFQILLSERKISEMTDGSKVTDLIIIAKKVN